MTVSRTNFSIVWRSGKLETSSAAHRPDPSAFGEQVMASNCTLQAVMARLTVQLSAVMGLELGMVVPLGSAALDRIDLEGMDGRKLGCGKLGQNRGMRAVRLSGEAAADGAKPTATKPLGAAVTLPETQEEPYRATGTG